MSALDALASYDVSDDEGGEGAHREVIEESKSDEQEDIVDDIPNETEKTVEKPPQDIDDEDIWQDPNEETEKKEEEENEQDDNDKEAEEKNDDSVNIEDLSGIRDESDNEQSNDEAENSGEEEDEENVVDDVAEVMKVTATKRNKRKSSENATNLAKKLRSASIDEVAVPSEPEGRCSSALQEKIIRFMDRKVNDREDLNQAIQARKDFRNPSIYEKLIVYLGIDELGTNFPPQDYNPKTWRKAPAYDELARAQREDMAKREKERKTKVEFVTGMVKKPSSTNTTQSSSSNDSGKKSKWDQQSSLKSGSSEKTLGPKSAAASASGGMKKKI